MHKIIINRLDFNNICVAGGSVICMITGNKVNDIDVFLHYTPNRVSSGDEVLTKLDASQVITQKPNPNGNGIEIMGGLYTLTLPTNIFNRLGIYTLMIRPAQIRTTITDCGILSALPNVKGLVIDLNSVPQQYRNKFTNQGLVGFRVEYLNQDGSKIPKGQRFAVLPYG
jgi:hypothetical protein